MATAQAKSVTLLTTAQHNVKQTYYMSVRTQHDSYSASLSTRELSVLDRDAALWGSMVSHNARE